MRVAVSPRQKHATVPPNESALVSSGRSVTSPFTFKVVPSLSRLLFQVETFPLWKVKERFYWPGIDSDVEEYIKPCSLCAKRKDPTRPFRACLGKIQFHIVLGIELL